MASTKRASTASKSAKSTKTLKSAKPAKPAKTAGKPKKPAKAAKTERPFDKYFYYSESVQSPEEDMTFADEVYKELNGGTAKTMREDFCGTFLNCGAWVARGKGKIAHGVDLDPEPLEWGKQSPRYLKLPKEQQARINLHQMDVLGKGLPKADVICGLNFSYFIFKDRPTLLAYFKNCHASLTKKGVLILDLFGGSRSYEINEEEIEYEEPENYSYFWDQSTFDPLTHFSTFHIHFRREGEKKRKNVFTYDWRMWTAPELKDLLVEAGFSDVHFYWEGSLSDGSGDGNFKITETGEDCPSWVAYIAAVK